MTQYRSTSEQETEAAGREIAKTLPRDAVIHLVGDLGAGKTLLVRAIAVALGADPLEVTSPSFAIVHEYPVPGAASFIHIDGYRLSENLHEWFEIGIPEMLREPGLKFIEWPKEAFRRFAPSDFEIAITVNDDQSRTITIT
ncbi:MAG: tRNA (adenosine(37)-N6)-threonylcarbamoyltransferase complex ATPase subunit type 1 TsaE [Thermoanaerobaculia bacterium]